ncbi:MAG TPA: hypothetical protein DEP88_08315, partial [Verrucomicrobiales bacterium]|nr:hypothetical protein [Verrucomicrobiales bacterium]
KPGMKRIRSLRFFLLIKVTEYPPSIGRILPSIQSRSSGVSTLIRSGGGGLIVKGEPLIKPIKCATLGFFGGAADTKTTKLNEKLTEKKERRNMAFMIIYRVYMYLTP